MSDVPVLTIVVPVYNGQKYLEQTIKCILQMTDIPIELLLIDDGSTDGSGEICRRHASLDKRVRYVYQENAGIAAARNKGVEQAAGTYICFADQDDRFLPEGMEALLSHIQDKQAELGMCSTMRRITKEKSVEAAKNAWGCAQPDADMTPYEKLHDAVYTGAEVREHLLYPLLFRGYDYPFAESGDYFYGSVWKCIFLRSFVKENGIRFEHFVHYEDDWIFVSHALSRAERAVTSSKAGYCWCVNPGSESHRGRFVPDMAERFVRLDEYVFSYIYKCIPDEAVRKAFNSITLCDHYVELIKNDAGAAKYGSGSGNRTGMTLRRTYRQSVKHYLEETDYREHLKVQRHLKRSAHRKKLILVIFSIAGIRVAYIISRVYDGVERRLERIGWLARLERKRKMSNR